MPSKIPVLGRQDSATHFPAPSSSPWMHFTHLVQTYMQPKQPHTQNQTPSKKKGDLCWSSLLCFVLFCLRLSNPSTVERLQFLLVIVFISLPKSDHSLVSSVPTTGNYSSWIGSLKIKGYFSSQRFRTFWMILSILILLPSYIDFRNILSIAAK